MPDSAEHIARLKKQLNAELQKPDTDNSVVLQLSHELAQLDNDQVRFSVDAGIINRLGKELVGRHETAVSELVKNAYDADATKVSLTFENAWYGGGTLTIADDGVGMDRGQLIGGFMRLSSADKIHNPISPRYGRTRAGKKGIGRFATQRLGNKLTIITQTLEAEKALEISIEWVRFETDKELQLISNQVKEVEKIQEEGTVLTIEGLRDAWSDAMIKRAYRYTSDLLQPFPLSEKRKESEEDRSDPGFQSNYFRKDGNETYPIVDDQEAFFQHALAEIEGYVLESGQGCWSLKSDRLNFPEEVFLIGKERDNNKAPFLAIKNVHFKCYYFIYEPTLLPKQTLSFIRSVANEAGGVRLYRNGFRVLPYGENGDDWLSLDASVRRRVILAPHANNNWFGFVEVSDIEGSSFNETSSREGLIENEAFHELTDFVYRCMINAVLKVAELRQRKKKTSQKDWEKKETKKTEDEVDSAISDLKSLVDDDSEGGSHGDPSPTPPDAESGKKEEIKGAIEKIEAARAREKEDKQALIEELNMLRVLAGLGLVIGEFVHEVERFLPAFDADISYLKKAVEKMKTALERTERLDTNLKSFTTYTSYFYEAISRNVLRELESIEIRDIVDTFHEVIIEDIKRSGYTFHKPIFEDYDLWTVPMHRSEWASILFNFYINSKKAIKRAGSPGELLIRAGREDGKIFVEFSDNGDGIPTENHDKIFNAFFTTTSAAGRKASDEEALSGIGLGLKIVRDIVESYDGEIYVAAPHEGFVTTMRIEIPENGSETQENE
ncbi:sensor histidine kinase [Roseivirga pacifica]|uniref:sensor histidine kinase n=1 Tax=Roseivirga pacifica TaxID=1267423 RepID=UPI003BAEA701